MKLLTIAYCLPPSIYPQSIQIGRLLYYLPKDYHLYVVTADEKGCLRDENFYPDIYEKFVDYIKIPFAYTIFIRIIRRSLMLPDEFIFWQIRAYKNIIKKWKDEKFDYIITFSHPLSSNLIGLWLKKFFKAKWIAFFSDPWVGKPYSNYKFIIKNLNFFLEKKTFTNADIFIFTSAEMQNMYLKKYPFIKSFYSEHSFDSNLYNYETTKKKDKLLLRYIGNIYGMKNPESLITAIRNLVNKKIINHKNFLFEIIGSLEKKYRNMEKDTVKNTVIFRKPVPYLESLKLMKEADVLVVIDADIKNSVLLPSKLPEYIGANKPILGITPLESASARIINKIGGWIVEPCDIQGIENTLNIIFTSYKNGIFKKFNISSEVKEKYNISFKVNKIIEILESNAT